MTLAERVRAAADKGRRLAVAFPGATKADDLPWKVVEAFDADVRGNVERDRRIEDERDRVLIASVILAESDGDDVATARQHLVGAIDYLEESVLRFGRVSQTAARLGYGQVGDRVSTER